MFYIEAFIAPVIAYLFGSLSSAIIVCKIMGLPDPRTQGSKNPGATNVLRIGGKTAAVVTLLGDVLKGVIPILIAKWYGLQENELALVASGAFIGHLYPVFFHFQGGKGVATALGCLLALSWPTGFAWMVTWLLIAIFFRYSSLSSLIASLLAPIYIWFFSGEVSYIIAITFISIVLIYRHRSNIIHLMQGKERKIHF
ncbi:MAG: glycerol-3-phosphate acyltransferase [Gammaproteobacteria bacterium RIFCSPHIGHO2_12_FULL_37_14]|nr:MAG: glycerol-3-phosphate acyltransferase [Gammaproteobacteria bacterium RIFCSPHIGHO2_12_FULL_37_14]